MEINDPDGVVDVDELEDLLSRAYDPDPLVYGRAVAKLLMTGWLDRLPPDVRDQLMARTSPSEPVDDDTVWMG